jgi:type II secretory pathway component PulC
MRTIKTLFCAALIVVAARPDTIWANDLLHSPLNQSQISTKASLPDYEIARLPRCSLNLVLTGTISGTPKKALIIVKGSNEESFDIDQAITNDVLLIDVDERNAVVLHNDELEKLELVSDLGNYEIDPALRDSNPIVVATVLPSASEAAWYEENKLPEKSHSYMGIQFEYSDFLTQAKLITDPTGGIQISESVPGGLYQRLGLQDGDNVRAINEKPVNSILDLMGLSHPENATDSINVEIVRNGNLYDLELDPKRGIEFKMVIDP